MARYASQNTSGRKFSFHDDVARDKFELVIRRKKMILGVAAVPLATPKLKPEMLP